MDCAIARIRSVEGPLTVLEDGRTRLEERIKRSPFRVSLCTPDQMPELGMFRYRVYVEQTGKAAAHADHVTKTLIEPIDFASSHLLVRHESGTLVGSARITTAANGWKLPPQCEPDPWPWVPPEHIACVSRTMIDRTCRNLIVVPQLFRSVCEWGKAHQIRLCGGFFGSPLLNLFLSYGWIPFADPFIDEFAGWQTPMVFAPNDRGTLEAAGSPLLSLVDASAAHPADVAYMRGLRKRRFAGPGSVEINRSQRQS